jgi:hypothetical protein
MNKDSPFDVSYKLIDLGLTGFVLANDPEEIQLRDVHGTKMYSMLSLCPGFTLF